MSTAAARPFDVLGVQQIAIGGTSKAALRALWVDMLGLAVTGTFRSRARERRRGHLRASAAAPARVEVDLMEPIDPDGKPAVHATPLNHVGLWIDDLRARGRLARGATACASRPAASAPARPATTSASSIRRRTTRSRSPARAC